MASCPNCGHPVEDGPPVAGVTNRELREILWQLDGRLEEVAREVGRMSSRWVQVRVNPK